MKDTILGYLKSKTLWAVITLQIIAIEPFVPVIKEYLPEELKYVAGIIIPIAILWAKVIRDKGILNDENTKDENEPIKEAVKKKAKTAVKTAVKKKVTEKISEHLEENNKK